MRLTLAAILTLIGGLVCTVPEQSFGQQGVFRVTFRATGKTLNEFNQETDARITENGIIANALAARGLPARAARNYVLVYNTTNDALQVVKYVDGSVLTDVIQFEGGAATTDQRQASRLTFMFMPDAPTAFGSALISEKWPGILIGDDNDRGNLTARMQFALTGDEMIGRVPVSGTNTNSVTITNIVTITNNPGTTNGAGGETNGLAITDFGNTNGGGLGTSLNPITETNALSLGSPATPPATTNTSTGTNGTSVSNGSLATTMALTSSTALGAAGSTNAAVTRLSAVAAGSSPGMFLTTTALGGTNAPNVRVYTGAFTVGRRFLPNGANSPIIQVPVSVVNTNGTATTNTVAQ